VRAALSVFHETSFFLGGIAVNAMLGMSTTVGDADGRVFNRLAGLIHSLVQRSGRPTRCYATRGRSRLS